MGNVEAEELVETLADVKIIGDTEGDVEGRALVDTLYEPLTDTDAETLGETRRCQDSCTGCHLGSYSRRGGGQHS